MAFIVCITLKIPSKEHSEKLLEEQTKDWHRDTGLSHETVSSRSCHVSGDFLPAYISDMFFHQAKILFNFFLIVKANIVYLEHLSVL